MNPAFYPALLFLQFISNHHVVFITKQNAFE